MINSLVMLEQIYVCACSLNPSSSFTRRSPSTAHNLARHFPLTPLFPLHTTIPPVSPLFPLDTKNTGWGQPARDGFSRSPTSSLLVSHETRAVSHILLCVQHVQRTSSVSLASSNVARRTTKQEGERGCVSRSASDPVTDK